MNTDAQPLIHIGYHRTGAAWLQREVFDRAESGFRAIDPLRAKARLVIPNPLDFDPAACRRSFEPELERASTDGAAPVLSAVRLSGSPYTAGYDSKEIAERLHAVFPHARILIVLREQRAALVSLYRRYVRDGGVESLRRFCRRPGFGSKQLGSFDFSHLAYDRLVRCYQELFGGDRVLVLTHERLVRDPREFVARIAGFAGATAPRDLDAHAARRGHCGLTLLLKRPANLIACRSGHNPGSLIESELAARANARCFDMLDAAMPEWVRRASDSRFRLASERLVGDRYARSNRLTATLTGLDLGSLGYTVETAASAPRGAPAMVEPTPARRERSPA